MSFLQFNSIYLQAQADKTFPAIHSLPYLVYLFSASQYLFSVAKEHLRKIIFKRIPLRFLIRIFIQKFKTQTENLQRTQ